MTYRFTVKNFTGNFVISVYFMYLTVTLASHVSIAVLVAAHAADTKSFKVESCESGLATTQVILGRTLEPLL